MKKLFSVLKYTKDYKNYTALNILFNIFFSVFSVFSISLTIPFLELIFKNDAASYQTIVDQGLPVLGFSMKGVTDWAYYHMSTIIIEQGKAHAGATLLDSPDE